MARRDTPALRTIRKLAADQALAVPPLASLTALRELATSMFPPKEWGDVLTVNQIAEALRKHRGTVGGRLNALRQDGKIRAGQYRMRGAHGPVWVYAGADVVEAAKRGEL